MSDAGVQSARSKSSPRSVSALLRRCVASSKSLFIRSCSTIKSCNGFHCCGMIHSPANDCLCGRKRRVSIEHHCVAGRRKSHCLTRQNFSLEQFDCEWILNQRLYGTLQRTSTITRIVTFTHQQFSGGRIEHQSNVALVQHRAQTLELHLDDLADLFA